MKSGWHIERLVAQHPDDGPFLATDVIQHFDAWHAHTFRVHPSVETRRDFGTKFRGMLVRAFGPVEAVIFSRAQTEERRTLPRSLMLDACIRDWCRSRGHAVGPRLATDRMCMHVANHLFRNPKPRDRCISRGALGQVR